MTKPEHPAPWKWVPFAREGGVQPELQDANGETVCHFGAGDREDNVEHGQAPPGYESELIAAAPEMEALLRTVLDGTQNHECPLCRPRDYKMPFGKHFDDCPIVLILARIDAAKGQG